MNEENHTVALQVMEMSDDISEIAKAMPKAQAAMGDVFKNANNPAFRSKYADLAAVVEAVLPALNSCGIALLQPTTGLRDGSVHVATMLLHESGQWLRCVMAITTAKMDAHGIGSAVTYGRRFGLQAMSGVAPTDDDGNAASQPSQRQSVKQELSGAVTTAGIAIDLCRSPEELSAWAADNKAALSQMSKADQQAVRVLYSKRQDALKTPFDGDGQ